MSRNHLPIAAALLVCLAGCSTKPDPTPPIGEAFVAPPTLKIRKELSVRSPEVAALKHGDRVDILQVRRRFVKIRVNKNAEGWTESRQLLTADQLQGLKKLRDACANAPTQGRAGVHEALNLHIEPNRQAPVFHQIPEKGTADVIARKLVPRTTYSGPALVAQPPAPVKKAKTSEKRPKKGAKTSESASAPPRPAPPAVPLNWLELSRRNPLPDAKSAEEPKATSRTKAQRPPEPVKLDEWNLVRTPTGESGWVLARMLLAGVPDGVAQYSEGQRVTSYLPLAEARSDDGEVHKHWLWTTLSTTTDEYDFDGFRVFFYNSKRSRYETAYRERKVTGYLPIQVSQTQLTEGRKTITAPTFTMVVGDEDGQFWKKTYAFQGYRVRVISKETTTKPAPTVTTSSGAPVIRTITPAAEAKPSFIDRAKQKVKGLLGR